MLQAILAVSDDDVIGVLGHDGKERLPWSIPDDLRRFKMLTMGHAVTEDGAISPA